MGIEFTLNIPAMDNVRLDVHKTSKNSLSSSMKASAAPIMTTPIFLARSIYSWKANPYTVVARCNPVNVK